jgi:hypothetical protein
MISISLVSDRERVTFRVTENQRDNGTRYECLYIDTPDGYCTLYATLDQLANLRDTISEYLGKQPVEVPAGG